jgi:hypothetical protein
MNARLISTARAACLLLVPGMVLLSGCRDSSEGISLSEVKRFDAYPLYYAGDEVAGNKLETIVGEDGWERNPDQRSVGFTFVYGDCDPPDGLFAEGGCAPPVQIQTFSICDRNLGMYRGKQDLLEIRGAKASTNGGGLEIFTGTTTVVIFALADPDLMKSTIRQLHRVDQDAPPSRLPPPVPGGVWGKGPCR